MPMEMSLPPPVGFQLVRDPSTGQFLFLPAATTIGKDDSHQLFMLRGFRDLIRSLGLIAGLDFSTLWWPGSILDLHFLRDVALVHLYLVVFNSW